MAGGLQLQAQLLCCCQDDCTPAVLVCAAFRQLPAEAAKPLMMLCRDCTSTQLM